MHSVIEAGAIVLFNGHEDDFLEEGVKIVLHSASDEEQLARQTTDWMARKAEAFSRFTQ